MTLAVQASDRIGPDLEKKNFEKYLHSVFGAGAEIVNIVPIGEHATDEDLKQYGYGAPIKVTYRLDGHVRHAVFETVHSGPYGHETMGDRAQLLLSAHETFGRLPLHARSLDVGALEYNGNLLSLGDVDEFFVLVEHVEGVGHNEDFFRMRDEPALTDLDVARSDALCDYLAEIHRVRRFDSGLYARRIRELMGHGECIMGINDGYPTRHAFIDYKLLENIEHRVLSWRWRLKDYTHRSRQVHGDFHPWNILFQEGAKFRVLDRSRGEWGEAGDDVSCLTINYLFFSLQRSGRLEGNFEVLFKRFWSRYLEHTGDREVLSVVAPFFAFRGLVIASPVWYPNLSETNRRRIFSFIRNVLDDDVFDPNKVNEYCEA